MADEPKDKFKNEDADDEDIRTLKHIYRWGVAHGAIDPDSDKGRDLWLEITGMKPWANAD